MKTKAKLNRMALKVQRVLEVLPSLKQKVTKGLVLARSLTKKGRTTAEKLHQRVKPKLRLRSPRRDLPTSVALLALILGMKRWLQVDLARNRLKTPASLLQVKVKVPVYATS